MLGQPCTVTVTRQSPCRMVSAKSQHASYPCCLGWLFSGLLAAPVLFPSVLCWALPGTAQNLACFCIELINVCSVFLLWQFYGIRNDNFFFKLAFLPLSQFSLMRSVAHYAVRNRFIFYRYSAELLAEQNDTNVVCIPLSSAVSSHLSP